MIEIYTYIVDMPVDEAVRPCGAFSYSIYINARLSQKGRENAYIHALRHIENGDFEKNDVQTIETDARRENADR